MQPLREAEVAFTLSFRKEQQMTKGKKHMTGTQRCRIEFGLAASDSERQIAKNEPFAGCHSGDGTDSSTSWRLDDNKSFVTDTK